ncbi:MAG: DNA-processing protein DprA, partial [Patescibacteria group bacterium]
IEAGERSGTLITARLTTEYNRDVYAVPGSIFSPSSYGTNWLIRQGATPITGAKDLLEALGFKIETEIKNKINLAELTHDEKKVYEILAVEPLPRDELIMTLELEPSVANTLLMMMELKNIIKESAGEFRLQ